MGIKNKTKPSNENSLGGNRHSKGTTKRESQSENSSEAFLAAIINHLPLAMFCKDYSEDGRGKIVAWNNQAEQVFGLKANQVLGKTDRDFFPEEQCVHFERIDRETLASGVLQFTNEEQVGSEAIGFKTVRTWKVPVMGRFLLGISQDISQLKSLEKEVEKQKLMSFQASKLASLGEMAGGIAHEINNPLGIISGLVEMARRKKNAGKLSNEESDRITNNILDTITRIKVIVDGLRTLSRDDSHAEIQPIDVQRLVSDVLRFSEERCNRYGITVDFKNLETDNLNYFAMAREVQFSQVVVNLVNNAVQAVRNLPDRWIKVTISREAMMTKIIVQDSGLGIPVAVRAKIFEPFFTTKDVGEGTGLGLSISKSIISSYGGKLYYDDGAKNTTFVIEVPNAADLSERGAA